MDQERIIKMLQDNREYVYQEEFFELLKSTSLLTFRKNINLVQEFCPTLYLEEKVQKYYQELLKEFDDKQEVFGVYGEIIEHFVNQDFDYLENYHDYSYFIDEEMMLKIQDFYHYRDGARMTQEFLKQTSSQKISEIVVDGLFGDTIYNVWINIREMLRYGKVSGKLMEIFGKDRYQFYLDILNIDTMKNQDKIKMYYAWKEKRVDLQFYRDLRLSKNLAYQDMKENLFQPAEKQGLYQEKQSHASGVPIYELNGEEFYMLVRCQKEVSDTAHVRRHCYTLISGYHMEVFDEKKFIYGYTDIDIQDILHVFERDAYSSSGKVHSSTALRYVNRIMMPWQISDSPRYSEIQIVNKAIPDSDLFTKKKPSYLVVFDKIREENITEAKRLDIPIVLIHRQPYLSQRKKYYEENGELDFLEYVPVRDDYTDGSFRENERKRNR